MRRSLADLGHAPLHGSSDVCPLGIPDRVNRAPVLSKVATFGEHRAGLGEFTRTPSATGPRRAVQPTQAAGSVGTHGAGMPLGPGRERAAMRAQRPARG